MDMSKFNWWVRACGIILLWATAAVALPAQTFKTLHDFCSEGGQKCKDGGSPGALVQATNGDLYGTTEKGGPRDRGTIFKITTSGKLTSLYRFCAYRACPSYWGPSGLIQATDGNLYGTTREGGAIFYCGMGCGTIYKITLSGVLTTLHVLSGVVFFGPSGLVQATDGKFFGTTEGGGSNQYGTVFSMNPGGKLTLLHSFDGTDGQAPFEGLVQGTDGRLYGTTSHEGANGLGGTVFSITTDGTFNTLHSFDGTDGLGPSQLIQGTDGSFYGTTTLGGVGPCLSNSGCGTVFKITPTGDLTTLYSFCAAGDPCPDGAEPAGGLIQGTDGNFYGTTFHGGTTYNNGGTVFSITPTGTLRTLHSFCSQTGCPDGDMPYGGVIQDTDGKFYGTTSNGGLGAGTAFSLSVGLGPFIETLPTSGTVGTAVTILGTNLTDVTNVRFNGLESKFTIASASEITTTVPNGATTGPVRVITPTGKLQSNVPFTVN
jgi:uncharacterized repeat protein (TIGR03803 family)